MALSRIKNPEQLKQCKPEEIGRIIGLNRIPEVKCLREKINLLTQQGKATELNNLLLEEWYSSEQIFDGKWVLQRNLNWPARDIALKYKELWQVEHVFRDTKSLLDTRPIFQQRDYTIRGHVFCSFLALVLRKELDRRLEENGYGI